MGKEEGWQLCRFVDEIHRLFTNAGLEEVQNLEDRRIQVNRGKKVVMHRVWMQSKYRKLKLSLSQHQDVNQWDCK